MGSVPNVGLIQKQKNMVLMTNIPNDCWRRSACGR
jgi:hypothetical protein